VRAGLVESPEEYQWSSHHNYLLPHDKTSLIDTAAVLGMFSEDKGSAYRLYKAFMENDAVISREEVYSTAEQRILGDERFVENVLKERSMKIQGLRRDREYSLEQIAAAVERVYGIPLEKIRSINKSPGLATGKKVMSLVAHEYGYKGKDIADFIDKDPVVVTRHLKERAYLEKEIQVVLNDLKSSKSHLVIPVPNKALS
jgi:hypothetical protein